MVVLVGLFSSLNLAREAVISFLLKLAQAAALLASWSLALIFSFHPEEEEPLLSSFREEVALLSSWQLKVFQVVQGVYFSSLPSHLVVFHSCVSCQAAEVQLSSFYLGVQAAA